MVDPYTEPGCFIATAAYGTPYAHQIDILRDFRDIVLLKRAFGRRFVGFYYKLSPPIARTISKSSTLRFLVRALVIKPVTSLVRLILN